MRSSEVGDLGTPRRLPEQGGAGRQWEVVAAAAGHGDWIAFIYFISGVCMEICYQVSFLQSGSTCQKPIKRAKSPDQCFLQRLK